MGVILSRFKKRKETTFQILEGLDNRIKEIEDFSRDTEQRQRTVVGQLILYSVGLYVLAAIFFYFYYFPTSLRGQIFCITPLLIFPILVILVKRLVQWYYHRKIERNQQLLSELKDEKREMLENVKDNETYKVAKQILEKFAPDQLRKPMPMPVHQTPMRPMPGATPARAIMPSQLQVLATPGGDLRRRIIASPGQTPTSPEQAVRASPSGQFAPPPPYRPPMARPIIPADRSYLDKVVEYLVGDGPSNRFALICKQCHSHNGMALKEEFEYLAFHCCFCLTYNPARKQRPLAPRLPSASTRALQGPEALSATDADTASDSAEETNSEPTSGESQGDREEQENLAEEEKTEEAEKPSEETTSTLTHPS